MRQCVLGWTHSITDGGCTLRITALGHSCVEVDGEAARVVIDPGTWSRDVSKGDSVDHILVTHEHDGHFDAHKVMQLLATNPSARVSLPERAMPLLAGYEERALPAVNKPLLVGDLQIEGIAGKHSESADIENVAYMLTDGHGCRLLHPGDQLDVVVPPKMDVLLLPIHSTWLRVSQVIDMLHRVSPRQWVPIHDSLLSPVGRREYLDEISRVAPQMSRMVDIGLGETVEIAS